ncbi:MAG: hypothetical protein EPO35_13350 [Acidobacteria bacterium]|nr:MAG: hypothetical protein EPO35_13350 [Acidobacteriota bacterium]
MDVAALRKRILRELDRPGAVKPTSAERRASGDTARQQFARLLDTAIVPLLKQTADILKAEGALCRVHTPSDHAKLAFDRSAEEFIEFMLDTTVPPHVIGRSSARRKGATLVEDRIIGVGKEIDEITDEDVVAYLLPELRKILK